jgi:outer membrane lipoprotein-sorting protein
MKAAVLGLALVLALAGCGKKDAGEVAEDLQKVMDELVSYQGKGTMTLHTTKQPQAYSVEIWYQAPHYYRVALTNAGKDVTQIVLKNDDGVFVLTPHLNKSFRFQSTWPEQHGQAYMYQTLADSIIQDKNRQFTTEGDAYVFDVVSNLQNRSIKRQRIWLDKDNYAPIRMQAMDENARVLLEMEFDSFQFNPRFDDDSFDMERNMTGYQLQTAPALADLAGRPADDAGGRDDFGILYPAYLPEGVSLKDVSEIRSGEDRGVLLRYDGTYPFTLTEIRPKDRAVSAASGTVVDLDLGFAVGVLLEGDAWKTLSWVHDGIEFRLAAAGLPYEEMVKIAQSMENQVGK